MQQGVPNQHPPAFERERDWRACDIEHETESREWQVVAVTPCNTCGVIFFNRACVQRHMNECEQYTQQGPTLYYYLPERRRLLHGLEELINYIWDPDYLHEVSTCCCVQCGVTIYRRHRFIDHMMTHENRYQFMTEYFPEEEANEMIPLPTGLKTTITYLEQEHIDPDFPNYCKFCNALLRTPFDKRFHSCKNPLPKHCTFCGEGIATRDEKLTHQCA